MAYKFRLPEMGEGLTEGDIASFLVKEGDQVKDGDPLVEIQTDKSTTQLVSPVAGTIKKIEAKEDDHVEKGNDLVLIDDGKDGVSTNVEDEDAEDASGIPGAEGSEIRQRETDSSGAGRTGTYGHRYSQEYIEPVPRYYGSHRLGAGNCQHRVQICP